MKYFDVAWDFDGTLYHSYPFIIHCLTEALRTFGVTDAPEKVEALAHVAVSQAIDYYTPLCGCPREDVLAAYRAQVTRAGCSDLAKPYEGIPELLRDIVKAGGRNHICSHRGSKGCKMYLQRDGLDQYFDCFVCPDTPGGLKSKPAPDYILHLLEQRGIAPSELIMVGDRNLDIEAAHAAGSAGCLFDPDGFATVTCNPEFHASDINDLRRILLG